MTYLRSSAMKRGRTEVYHNPYEVVSKVIEFVEKASEKVDACVDHTRPSLIDDIEVLKQSFIRARERGIKLRFVTEITIDNLNNCKQLVKSYVSELRHLDGIRGRGRITVYAFVILLVQATVYSNLVISDYYDRLMWDNTSMSEFPFIITSAIIIFLYRRRKWPVPDTSFPKKARKRRPSTRPGN